MYSKNNNNIKNIQKRKYGWGLGPMGIGMCRLRGAEVAYQVLPPGLRLKALAKEQNGLPHIDYKCQVIDLQYKNIAMP